MSENMRYCAVNLVESATLVSVSTENINYLKENLYNQRPGKPFKFTQFSGEIETTFASASTVNFIGIINHNFASTATVNLELSSTLDWSSPASYTKQVTIANNNCYATFTDQIYQYSRVTISGNAASIKIGELIIGNSILTNMNYQWGYSEDYQYKNEGAETVFGQDWSYRLTEWLEFKLSFDVKDTTKEQLIAWIDITKGKDKPFCFITYDKGVKYCRHIKDDFSFARRQLNRTRISFDLKEIPLGKTIT